MKEKKIKKNGGNTVAAVIALESNVTSLQVLSEGIFSKLNKMATGNVDACKICCDNICCDNPCCIKN